MAKSGVEVAGQLMEAHLNNNLRGQLIQLEGREYYAIEKHPDITALISKDTRVITGVELKQKVKACVLWDDVEEAYLIEIK